MSKNEPFIVNRIKSVGYAFKGAWILLSTESSIKVQFGVAIIMTFAGFYFDISRTEWMVQTLAIGFVLGIEGLNTAIEDVANFIHPDYNSKIGLIKDISAGAVFMAALSAIIIGLIIYFPRIF